MKILIKLGGTLLDQAESRRSLARQLVALAQDHAVTVVHGGGKQVTNYLEERGVASRFIDGLRVSDERVIEAVTRVIAGSVNKQLVAAISEAGGQAVGLSGIDGGLTKARQLRPELGYVGQPQRTEPRLLKLLLDGGYIPVVACIAGDAVGQIFNVNADQMAVSCAIGWGAERLFFLTDVAGVKGAEGNVIAKLDDVEVRALIDEGVARGGMQAKLDASLSALAAGLEQVVIASGAEADICRRLLDEEQTGTRILVGTPVGSGRPR